MPVHSQAQRRLMFAAMEGKVPGVPRAVGREFIAASHGITNLPEQVKRKKSRLQHLGRALRGGTSE